MINTQLAANIAWNHIAAFSIPFIVYKESSSAEIDPITLQPIIGAANVLANAGVGVLTNYSAKERKSLEGVISIGLNSRKLIASAITGYTPSVGDVVLLWNPKLFRKHSIVTLHSPTTLLPAITSNQVIIPVENGTYGNLSMSVGQLLYSNDGSTKEGLYDPAIYSIKEFEHKAQIVNVRDYANVDIPINVMDIVLSE